MKELSVENLVNYIMAHLMERPLVSHICEDFSYSRNYFEKKFKELFGISYTRFLNALLMRDAAEKIVGGGPDLPAREKIWIRQLIPVFPCLQA